jgi:hypothetical protein
LICSRHHRPDSSLPHGWSLPQQPQEVEATLSDCRPRVAGCPTHLSFDFLHELFDDGSRALGLLTLPAISASRLSPYE